MCKKILGIVIMTVIVVAAGWQISQNENEVKLSTLISNNVEALASSEGNYECIKPYTNTCGYEGNIKLPGVKYVN